MSDRADFEAWAVRSGLLPKEVLTLHRPDLYQHWHAQLAHAAWQAATERAQGKWLRWEELTPVDGMWAAILRLGIRNQHAEVVRLKRIDDDWMWEVDMRVVYYAERDSDGFLFHPITLPDLPPTASCAPNPTDLPSDAPERDTGQSGASEGVSRIDELERRVAALEAAQKPEPALRWLDHGNTYVLMRGDMPLGQVRKVFGVWVAERICHGGKNKPLGEFGNFDAAKSAVEKAVEGGAQ